MDTTLKIGKLSSLEEIAVGIVGERPAKSGTLSHYEDRKERKGWLVEGVHGISIARRNNWVQSGRLPYVTSAPFKRESAFALSSSSLILVLVPVLPFSPFSNSPGACLRAGKKTSSTREKEEKKRDQKKATTGRSVRGRGKDGRGREGEEGQEGQKEERRQKRGRRAGKRGRARETWIWKKRGARAHCGNRGRRSGALLVSKPAVGDREGGRKKPWKKNAEERSRGGGEEGGGATGPLNKNNATGNTEQKQREGRAKQPTGSEKGEES